MYNEGLSPADLAAVTGNNNNDGMFGGNGAWWIIILFLFAFVGWGNGNAGFGGNSGAADNYVLASDFATIQRQLSDGFNSIDNALDRQNTGICDLGYTNLSLNNQTNMNMMQGFNQLGTQLADCCCKTQQNIKDVDYNIATTGANIQYAIKDCCCENEKIAMQSRFDAAQNTCNTLQAIDKLGDRIIDYMAADKAQTLRDENQALRLAASQQAQNNYLVNTLVGQIAPRPVPAFSVNPPYQYAGCAAGCACANNYNI